MAPVTYTMEEKDFMFRNFILTQNAAEVRRLYHQHFYPNLRHAPLPDTKTIARIAARHDETGSLNNRKPSGRPRTLRTIQNQIVSASFYL